MPGIIERDIENAWLATDGQPGPLDDLIGHSINVVRTPALNHRLDVDSGVLGDECATLLRDFFAARRGTTSR